MRAAVKCAAAVPGCAASLAVHLYKMCVLSDPPFCSPSLPFLLERVQAHREWALQSLQTLYTVSVLPVQYFFTRSVLPLLSQHSLHQISVLPPSLRPSKVCVPSVSSTQPLLLLLTQSLRTYFSLPPSHFPLLYLPPLCPSLPPSPLPSFTSPPSGGTSTEASTSADDPTDCRK